MDPYRYLPLQHYDSIRILKLHPGPRISPLEIDLLEVRLQESPVYEALSYTWATETGDDSLSSVVICDGAMIPATKNCEAALQRLREEDGVRILWVDAICICQTDIAERGHQVGLMRYIYGVATAVMIWLGEASQRVDPRTNAPDSDTFMAYLGPLAADMRKVQDAGYSSTYSSLYGDFLVSASEPFEGVEVFLGYKADPLLLGMVDITRRRWWQRVWVVQEVSLAAQATLICGEQSVAYSDFVDVLACIADDDQTEAAQIQTLLAPVQGHLVLAVLATKFPGTLPFENYFLTVLNRVRSLQCTDPRDKIFGISGLYASMLGQSLPPTDYDKSAGEIYADVARTYMTKVKKLDLQCSASVAAPVSTLELPSWVPDFSKNVAGDESMLTANRDFDADRGDANINHDAIIEISADNKTLRVLGKRIDSIREVSLNGFHQANSSLETTRGRFLDACDLALPLGTYPTRERLTIALLRTLSFNRAPETELLNFESRFGAWYDYLKGGGGNLEYVRAEKPSFWMTSSPLCVTTKGYIGIIPLATAPGDVIAVLRGARVPLVIRRVEVSTAGWQAYQLVGPCYVHGIMNGEAFPEDESELESIHLV